MHPQINNSQEWCVGVFAIHLIQHTLINLKSVSYPNIKLFKSDTGTLIKIHSLAAECIEIDINVTNYWFVHTL